MLQLNYLHLHHFYIIAREGQIARAARRLRIGQPTLSTQLKSLEEAFGFILFDRKRGETLRLTEKGKVIFTYTQEIFRIGQEMAEVSQGLKTKKSSNLRIGALDTLPKRLVFQLMQHALQITDGVVSIFEDSADQLFDKLSRHRYDLVVSTAAAPQSERFPVKAKKLNQYPVIICGTEKYLPLKKKFPKSLCGQPFTLPTADGKLRPEIDEYLAHHEADINVIGEAQDAEILRLVALAGIAMVPLSYLTVQEDLSAGRLHVIGELKGLHEELWISSSPRLVKNEITSRFMKLTHI